MQKDIVERTFEFALNIISLGPLLPQTSEGWIIGKQGLRSGTSIGANVEEAQSAFSKKEFVYTMNIALREARETHYWLRLIRRANLARSNQLEGLLQECDELKRILGAIVSKARGKRKVTT